MTPTPEMIAMAREIAGRFKGERLLRLPIAEKIALTAIMETSEKAAEAMEGLCFFTDAGDLLQMTKQEMSVRTCHEGAKAIRNGEHLR